jgi:predicted HAD superfamily phosphohydrolase YqeG
MNHDIKDHTTADLLSKSSSPYTTPDQKREALDERRRRKRVIIVDIDATLVGSKDAPIENVCNIIRGLKDEETEVVMITARSNSVRKKTMEWLKIHDVPCDGLLMRPTGNSVTDAYIKRKVFNDEFLKLYNFSQVWFVLEDRNECVDMWRGEGLTCLQVAPGDY